jgi:hypothetical protein
MPLEDITLSLFAVCNSIRVFAYVPQIRKAAVDRNGASAISYTTWALFFITHVSTVGYALVNREDWWMAVCFTGNAICCLCILGLAFWNRSSYRRRLSDPHGHAASAACGELHPLEREQVVRRW